MAPKRIAILTNFIPSYRQGFYDRLFQEPGLAIDIYCQKISEKEGFLGIQERYGTHVKQVAYRGLSGNRLIWHRLPWRKLYRAYDYIITDGNPRHLAQALTATALRLLGKPVIVWSVAYSRNNNAVLGRIRLTWWRLFKNFLLYTEGDKENLHREGFTDRRIVAINNSLDQRAINESAAHWTPERLTAFAAAHHCTERTLLLSTGRVVAGKYELMLDALERVKATVPRILWVLIGDGPARARLEASAEQRGLGNHVHFVGAQYEEQQLAPWFLLARAYVHPASIGLSLLHAFGYGLPVITMDNTPYQGPEFYVFADGVNGLLYEDQNADDLADKIVQLLQSPPPTLLSRAAIRAIPELHYNTDVMAARFKQMISIAV